MISGKFIVKIATIVSIAASKILYRNETGTAFFGLDDKTYFYMDARSVKLNILRKSPRSLLTASDYKQCNTNLNNYCDGLFQTFDKEIFDFLNLNLVKKLRKSVLTSSANQCPENMPYPYFNGKWCCTSNKEKQHVVDPEWAKTWGIRAGDGTCDGGPISLHSKCCAGKASPCKDPPCMPGLLKKRKQRHTDLTEIHPYAKIELEPHADIPNSTSHDNTLVRQRRGVPIIAQFVIVVVMAVSAFFIGESFVESNFDNVQIEVLQQEQALKSLTNAVEFDHETLDSVVNQLQLDPDLVLAPNVSSVPTFYKYMKSKTTHADFDPNKNVRKFQRFYANHISELSIDEAKAFESNVLQLQNNRLPLDKNFLIALRAKCLAVQSVHAPVAQMFCNDLAFHATRWDTGLKFEGVGFELEEKKIKSIIYSIEVQVPILYEGGLAEYEIINLGRFLNENTIRKILLPAKAVVTAAGVIRPLSDSKCINMQRYKVCPKHAIGPFSSCLQSVFNSALSSGCPVVDTLSPSTCTSQLVKDYMAISMFGNGTMHFDLGRGDLLLKPAPVTSFAILARQSTQGTLFCKQSKHKHVTPDLILPALEDEQRSFYKINEIDFTGPKLIDLLPIDTQVHVMQDTLKRASISIESTEKLLAEAQQHTSTTMQHFQSHVNTAVQTVEAKVTGIFWDMFLKVILPITLPAIALLILFVIFSDKLKALCERKMKIPKTESMHSRMAGNHMQSNREDQPIDRTET